MKASSDGFKNPVSLSLVKKSILNPREREKMKRGREEETDKESELDKKRRQQFLLACASGGLDKVVEFIESHIDVNARDRKDDDPMRSAINDTNFTGLHFAAKQGHVDIVKVLLQNGADVNAVTLNRKTGLHFAAQFGHVEVVIVLIQNGADVNAVAIYRDTPLLLACNEEYFQFTVAELLIQNGADVNAVNGLKRSALHKAIDRGHFCLVMLLIQKDAGVNAVTSYGQRPLHTVVRKPSFKMDREPVYFVNLLLQHGADVNALDRFRKTALEWTHETRKVSCSLELLGFGADIDTVEEPIGILREIKDRLNLLRVGKRIGTSLMSKKEKRFMWNLAFSFTIQHRAAAFKAFYAIRPFITFHGIFMVRGYVD